MALTLGYERFVRESTDANGNTVLAGADGILPMLGANTITVGAGGMYATIREALDYIVAQDTYTEFNVVGLTSAVTEDTKLVTLSIYATSTTSNTIGLGDKTFVLAEADRSYTVGDKVSAWRPNDMSIYVSGTVKSWDSGTKTLVLTATETGGTLGGTVTTWRVGTNVYTISPHIHMGDLWSGDDGVNWYEIGATYSETKLTIEIPYQGATITAGTTRFARPIWYNVVLLPGEHGVEQLNWPTTKPTYINMRAMSGARFTGDAIEEGQIFIVPKTGHLILENLVGIATKKQSAFFDSVTDISVAPTSIIELNDCDVRSQGVDVWIPGGGIGRLVIRGGYYEAGQDVFVNDPADGIWIYNSELVGSALVNFLGAGQLALRFFDADTSVYAKDTVFRIKHPVALFMGTSCIIPATLATKFTADACTFDFDLVGAATTACIVGAFNGVAGKGGNVSLNNCVMRSVHASGTPTVMQADTYTGTGTVKVNNCVLNGFIAGGGGTIIPSLNNCSA